MEQNILLSLITPYGYSLWINTFFDYCIFNDIQEAIKLCLITFFAEISGRFTFNARHK